MPIACVILSLSVMKCPHRGTEETLSTPVQVTHHQDFDQDGKPDQFVLSWKLVADYTTDYEGKQTKEPKTKWYQVSFKIISARGRILLDDIYSFKANEFKQEIIGPTAMPENLTPQEYFAQYFTMNPNREFEFAPFRQIRARITADEIDRDDIERLIAAYKSPAKPEEIAQELLTGEHDIILYERSWYEDIGMIVYSRILDRAVYLARPD